MRFSPGPWRVDTNGDVTAAGFDIAKVFDRFNEERGGYELHSDNARLIVAAPSLYFALRAVVDEGPDTEANRRARALLKRVEEG